MRLFLAVKNLSLLLSKKNAQFATEQVLKTELSFQLALIAMAAEEFAFNKIQFLAQLFVRAFVKNAQALAK